MVDMSDHFMKGSKNKKIQKNKHKINNVTITVKYNDGAVGKKNHGKG